MRVCGYVNGWVDIVAFAVVVGATDEELEFWVGFGVVDGLGKFCERGGVNYRADEVFKGSWGASF